MLIRLSTNILDLSSVNESEINEKFAYARTADLGEPFASKWIAQQDNSPEKRVRLFTGFSLLPVQFETNGERKLTEFGEILDLILRSRSSDGLKKKVNVSIGIRLDWNGSLD